MTGSPAFTAVSRLEGNIADVERWGNTLIAIGANSAHIEPGILSVIGWAIKRLGDDLDVEWRTAFEAVGGQP